MCKGGEGGVVKFESGSTVCSQVVKSSKIAWTPDGGIWNRQTRALTRHEGSSVGLSRHFSYPRCGCRIKTADAHGSSASCARSEQQLGCARAAGHIGAHPPVPRCPTESVACWNWAVTRAARGDNEPDAVVAHRSGDLACWEHTLVSLCTLSSGCCSAESLSKPEITAITHVLHGFNPRNTWDFPSSLLTSPPSAGDCSDSSLES